MTSPLSGKNTLDKIITYCLRNNIFTVSEKSTNVRYPYQESVVKNGRFIFGAHPHSTGCSIQCWVTNDEGEVYEIISTTYWYSSSYTFNESRWEHGAWDTELNKTIKMLEEAVAKDKDEKEKLAKAKWVVEEVKKASIKVKFESLFVVNEKENDV